MASAARPPDRLAIGIDGLRALPGLHEVPVFGGRQLVATAGALVQAVARAVDGQVVVPVHTSGAGAISACWGGW